MQNLNDLDDEDWSRLKGEIRRHWGILTETDLEEHRSRPDQIAALVAKEYNLSLKEAEQKLEDVFRVFKEVSTDTRLQNIGPDYVTTVERRERINRKVSEKLIQRGQDLKEPREQDLPPKGRWAENTKSA